MPKQKASKAVVEALRRQVLRTTDELYRAKLAEHRDEYEAAVRADPSNQRDHFIRFKAERDKTKAAHDLLISMAKGEQAAK